ncbi:MAG: hypothetical protein WDN26_02770 [Chitinophagaceae bacterium]
MLLFIFILNLVAFLYISPSKNFPFHTLPWGGIFILIFAYRMSGTAFKKIVFFWLSVIGIEVFWLWIGNWKIAGVMLILFLLSSLFLKESCLFFSTWIIFYTLLFPVKKIAWDELNNVIFKDQWLTIDFKNNKLIQQKIETGGAGINEKEFNDFCSWRLNR